MLPREKFDKNGAIWCNLGVPKSAITKLKINNFKVIKSTTTKANCLISPVVNLDVHVIRKQIHLEFTRGSGGYPPRSRRKFKKIKQNGGFSFIFFLFGRAP